MVELKTYTMLARNVFGPEEWFPEFCNIPIGDCDTDASGDVDLTLAFTSMRNVVHAGSMHVKCQGTNYIADAHTLSGRGFEIRVFGAAGAATVFDPVDSGTDVTEVLVMATGQAC